jgi:integrase/recombinase XerD
MKPPAPTRFVDLFLDMVAAERGGAANTLEAYRRDLADLSAYLAGRRRTVATATTADLRAYLGELARRGLAASSVARRLSAIRQFHRFLYAEGHRGDDPSAILEGPKRGRSLPKILSVGEVDRLIATARHAAELPGQPDRSAERLRAQRLLCLIELIYATGLRISELIALPASAARRDERMLIVRGKGGKERLVPLNGAAIAAMRAYRTALAEVGPKSAGALNRNGCFPPSANPGT